MRGKLLPQQLRLPLDLEEIETRRVSDRRVVRYARRYIAARVHLDGASADEILIALVRRDEALHDLILAAGELCDCDPGTCPGISA